MYELQSEKYLKRVNITRSNCDSKIEHRVEALFMTAQAQAPRLRAARSKRK
jgi:hypothetical protein